jgi:hypothetical protein
VDGIAVRIKIRQKYNILIIKPPRRSRFFVPHP